MMKARIIIFSLLLYGGTLFSQVLDTVYFDRDWKVVEAGDHSWYRIAEISGDLILIEDYSRNGNLQMKATLRNEVFVRENIDKVSEFPGYNTGIDRFYRENGEMESTVVWNPFDFPELLTGNGLDTLVFADTLIPRLTLSINFSKGGILQSIGFRELNCENQGLWKYYDRKGYLLSSIEFLNGVQHGRETYYFPDATPAWIIEYKNGIRDGTTTWYHSSGVIKHTKEFKNGKQVSKTKGADQGR